jgi:hypothetical protein
MLLALVLQAAVPQTAVDAERAFDAAAQAKGQWTAFREFMTPDAVMFDPQPVKASEILPEKNPPIAVQWWPAESYVSCDGSAAVNTGPWVRPKSSGYFTTVWLHQTDGGWKWAMDHGDVLAQPRPLPEKPRVRRAACDPVPLGHAASLDKVASTNGASADKSLQWRWTVWPDGRRIFAAFLWNGRYWEPVIRDEVAAPSK